MAWPLRCRRCVARRAVSLTLLLAGALQVAAKPKQKALPVAVEAQYKERITAKFNAALDKAASHLALALGATSDAGSPSGVFGNLYELELNGESDWKSRCETDIDVSRDSIAFCAVHKLQALTALCTVPAAAERYRDGISRLLKQLLGKRDTLIPGLGVKRSLLPGSAGVEAWLVEMAPKSGNFDVVVAVHAAAMLSVVRCGKALGEPRHFETVHSWFAALKMGYPEDKWKSLSYHINGILWESLVIISSVIRRDSSFAEDLRDYLADFETYLERTFKNDHKIWSFSAAHATALTWTMEAKKSRRKKLGKSMDMYMDRWSLLSPSFQINASYTCGPLQGLVPLLLKRGEGASEMVTSVLKMAEKDIDLWQIDFESGTDGARSAAAQRLGDTLLARESGKWLRGAFVRDEGQLRVEKRNSIRLDDTAQCVLALTRTLSLLDELQGVEIAAASQAEGADAEPAASDLDSRASEL